MTFKFEISSEELIELRETMAKNGITDTADQDAQILEAQTTGQVAMFKYGSLLHTRMSDLEEVHYKGSVSGKSAKFTQAFTYYAGTAGLPTLMLAMEDDENGITHGAVGVTQIKSARDLITYYDDLQARENPVNNPIYEFDKMIEVTLEDGTKVKCLSCLSNQDGPLHLNHSNLNEGEQLTLDETALILAHAFGADYRLDNKEFRNVEGRATGVEKAQLGAHHLTGAAYVYHYLHSYREWGFPRNEYLETLVEKINHYRDCMYPDVKNNYEDLENAGNRPAGLGPRDEALKGEFNKLTQEEVFKDFVKANDKLHAILIKNPNYANWDREWGAPNPYKNIGNVDPELSQA